MAQNDEVLQVWATGVWLDLFSPTNTTVSTISGYAVQPSTLGRLNNLVMTCFTGSGYAGTGTSNYQIGPYVTSAELTLIGQMYLVSYYNGLAQASMGMGGNGIPWVALAEGDSKIARANPANLGKEYREMARTAAEQLAYLANAYRSSQGGSVPRDVEYLSIGYANWGAGYWPY